MGARTAVAVGAVAVVLLAGAAEARKPVAKRELEGVVNLNTATAAQLDQLPGLGATAVKRILEHRAKTPFAKADELTRVKGIGKKRFEKLRPYVAVTGPTTLKEKRGAAPTTEAPPSAQGRSLPAKR